MLEDENYQEILGLERNAVRLTGPWPEWTDLYAEESARIQETLGSLLLGIEHFGSTSIPGIKAKPIIDILVGVARYDDGALCVPLMESIGYDYVADVKIAGDWVFGKGECRTHLVHIVEFGGTNWTTNLAFRDAMRSDPDLAHEYEALKIRLCKKYPIRAQYTAAKADFITLVIESA